MVSHIIYLVAIIQNTLLWFDGVVAQFFSFNYDTTTIFVPSTTSTTKSIDTAADAAATTGLLLIPVYINRASRQIVQFKTNNY